MKRYEALAYPVSKDVGNVHGRWVAFKPKAYQFIINKIFDYFEKERVCGKCISCNEDKDIANLYACKKGVAQHQSENYPSVDLDFGCNKWERKDGS